MKFSYKKFAPGLVRPVIPVGLEHGDETIRYEVLVDSGADMNIMNAEIADLLGLDLKSGRIGEVRGVTGKPEPYYTHDVTLIIGGHKTLVPISFAEKVGQDGYGIIGQKGFFDLYKVKFDYRKEEVEIVPYK